MVWIGYTKITELYSINRAVKEFNVPGWSWYTSNCFRSLNSVTDEIRLCVSRSDCFCRCSENRNKLALFLNTVCEKKKNRHEGSWGKIIIQKMMDRSKQWLTGWIWIRAAWLNLLGDQLLVIHNQATEMKIIQCSTGCRRGHWAGRACMEPAGSSIVEQWAASHRRMRINFCSWLADEDNSSLLSYNSVCQQNTCLNCNAFQSLLQHQEFSYFYTINTLTRLSSSFLFKC